ncbi:MAG: hypothetical protein ACREDS_04375 [Limisphaerales bacterium]
MSAVAMSTGSEKVTTIWLADAEMLMMLGGIVSDKTLKFAALLLVVEAGLLAVT